MRHQLRSDFAKLILDLRGLPARTIILQVVTPQVSVFFDTSGSVLDSSADAAGNPRSGWRMDSTMQPLPIPNFSGELWARAEKPCEIEVNDQEAPPMGERAARRFASPEPTWFDRIRDFFTEEVE